ncbi:uncharacterized protein B0H18DRAFT_1118392 [Fomitopsis serialis]|uniref:uncharacterized protein n=1 Tax=Fomitopsis serialis TaxID=139415 RepID=UPI002007C58B|nr:uncharacterized protein B0H18DRAFT_1118392 [Neoantrodia serialis]KAH9927585.1 hypothetical protein B0H18DRAFT_1118392 [Neoantrodia serialis]
MHVLFIALVAYALSAIAAPVSIPGASVAIATSSIVPSVSSVIIPTVSLSAVAPVPSNSSASAPDNAGGDEGEDESGEDQQDGDEDEQDENENEDEPDEDEEDEDEKEGDEDEDEEDSDDDSHSGGTHEKFRVEFEIDTKHSDVVLSSILQPADTHLDVKVELDAAKAGSLLSVLLGDLNRVLDDAANLVEVGGQVGGSGGGTGVDNGSAQNGTLTTQASRRSLPSRDLASRSEGKITLRAKTRLQEKH